MYLQGRSPSSCKNLPAFLQLAFMRKKKQHPSLCLTAKSEVREAINSLLICLPKKTNGQIFEVHPFTLIIVSLKFTELLRQIG